MPGEVIFIFSSKRGMLNTVFPVQSLSICGSPDLHLQGDMVRDGPNSITFNSVSANQTIHAVRANTVKTPGYDAFSASRSMSNTISALDKRTHAFKRRVQGQVLSEPALKAVEDRMLQQVQHFIDYIDGPEGRVDSAHGHGD
ncbi:hypothetical protein D0864_04334 [Hortaea werneckii]|uniref:Uncharacterized protein n=1 Tax=Hortaea werneckii TaxID=91943 RepID=A0A3M7GD30_HORWE|nr:hypothetical protein D0864_04334 [Hortaea werneckii]